MDRARTGQPDAARSNAFALQTCWDRLVEADCAADPRTAGYLPAVTPAGRAGW